MAGRIIIKGDIPGKGSRIIGGQPVDWDIHVSDWNLGPNKKIDEIAEIHLDEALRIGKTGTRRVIIGIVKE